METKHSYSGSRIYNRGRGYIGTCRCGWQSPIRPWMESAQRAVEAHIERESK